MNLPNKITIFRVLLIPVFTVFLLVPQIPNGNIYALIVFSIACISDFIDGSLARKYNLVTEFGKLMDPLADKLLVCSALICFVETRSAFPSWIVIVIIAREFIISAFRLVASDNGIVIAASMWGKIKTVMQMFMCIAFIIDFDLAWWRVVEQVLLYVSLVLTLISLFDYVYKNRKILTENVK